MLVDFPLQSVATRVRASLGRWGPRPCLSGDRSFTADELLVLIDRYRDGLAERGVGPGDLVGIALPRGADQVAAVLGTLERGAAYVPLDPDYPAARRQFMADDAGLSLLLEAPFTQSAPPSPIVASELDALAYVIYTSGSTGRPKGVEITHRNLSSFIRSWDGVVDPARPGVWLAHTPLSFDPSVVELLWTLVVGAQVVFAPEGSAWTGGVIASLIERFGVTHLQCTPTRAQILLSDERDRAALAGLTRILIGGEALTASLANTLLDLGPQLTNIYGPTETTVWAFAHDVKAPAIDPVPIGMPLPGVDVLLLDHHRRVGGNGQRGELVLFGADVARGYRNRSEQTAAHFIEFEGRQIEGIQRPLSLQSCADKLVDLSA